jgi:glutamyl-tRNA reductase
VLSLIGLNHQTAPIAIRERLAFAPSQLRDVLPPLRRRLSASELVLLSTCNRTELYLEGPETAAMEAVQWMQSHAQDGGLRSHLYLRAEDAAIHHLFRVASGLDSMVLGEHEVLGQVKNAYLAAQQHATTGKLFNVLFQRSLYVGKKVRTETALSTGAGSIGSVAVTLAERIFGKLDEKVVMILGAGKMAELTARHLLSQKVRSILVSNRTFERAQELAGQLGGRALRFEQALHEMETADIVICSTAAPHPIVVPKPISELMTRRKGRSLFFIDIAVPRDVHPDVHGIDNVYVYDIDDLQAIVRENRSKRTQDVERAEVIVDEKRKEFAGWLSAYRSGQPHALRHNALE